MTDPKIAISLFVLIFLIVPFYESKKLIIWETQRIAQKEKIFRSIVLAYSSFAEKVKENLGMTSFFEKEHLFWLKLKKSPVIFKKISLREKEKGKAIEKEIPKTKEEVKTPFKITLPFKILIVGDSFIAVGGGVGDVLERKLLEYKNVRVYRKGKVSSGLSRPDYFDWNLTLKELIKTYKPNIALVMLGLNDSQAITTPKGKVVVNFIYVGKEKWNKEYAKRVSKFLDIFKENDIIVFWIGLPVMRKKTFSDKVKNLNSIYEKEIKNYENSYFISTWDLFVDKDGNYVSYLVDKKGKKRLTRASDGIHLTYFGGKILAEKVIERIKEVIELEPKVKK